MKILFYPIADHYELKDPKRVAEYLTDSLYHGLVSLGMEVSTPYDMWWMHQVGKPRLRQLYGRGFSLYGLLEDRPFVSASIEGADLVVATVHSTMADKNQWPNNKERVKNSLLPILKVYHPHQIAFIDTLDQSHLLFDNLFGQVIYFKRELTDDASSFIRPVEYSIPACKIAREVPKKDKDFADIIPGISPYLFEEEAPYYADYARSLFGRTGKRGGWDCLRHYEILAAGSCPYFENLPNCPACTLYWFPESLCLRGASQVEGGRLKDDFDYEEHNCVIEELLEWTRKHLTTEASAGRLLEEMIL